MDARIPNLPPDPAALHRLSPGLNARDLCGGIDGWQSAGRPVVDKPEPATA